MPIEYVVDVAEGVQAELADAALHDFAFPHIWVEADNLAEALDIFGAGHD